MMKLLLVVAVLACTAAAQVSEWRVSHEATGEVAPELTFSLKVRNGEWLRAEALAVSDPQSASYGRRYSLATLGELLAPDAGVMEALVSFVVDELGCPREQLQTAPTRDSLTAVNCPLARVEQRLDVDYVLFRHASSGRAVLRASLAAQTGAAKLQHVLSRLPASLAEHVSTVTGVHELFSYPHEKKSFRRLLATASSSSPSVNNGPDILPALAVGASTLSVSAVIYCQNGVATTDSVQPCSDHPPLVTSVQLQLVAVGDVWRASQELSFTNTTKPQCTTVKSLGGVVCSFPERSIPSWQRVYVSAQSRYADGTASNLSTFVTAVAPQDYATPRLVHQLYGVPAHVQVTNPATSQAVAAFEGQYISLHDLTLFLQNMGVSPALAANVTIVGPNDPSQPGGESSLDIQAIVGVAPGAATTFWSVGGDVKAQGNYILKFFQQLNADPDAPLVSSISYGDTEDGFYNNYGSWDYINQCEVELQKLALRRRTIVSGTGDAGASNVGENGNDLSPTDPTCTPFRPFYPADSPFVTGVSATFLGVEALPLCRGQQLYGQPVVCSDVGEIAVSVSDGLFWTTGGGFSSYFARSAYQRRAVDTYLSAYADSLPPATYWNSTGQGYADVAALGHQLVCWIGGQPQPVDGTSMASPIFAALLTLLNDYVINHGGAPLGFVNPLLYALAANQPQVFNDVVVGSNADGDWQPRGAPYPIKCEYGFDCQPGWDPVTGLGSIQYQEILPFLPIVPVIDL